MAKKKMVKRAPIAKKARAKKVKATPEEELGLTGSESAADLYTMYVKAKSGSNEKLIAKIRGLWEKQYYLEKGNGKRK